MKRFPMKFQLVFILFFVMLIPTATLTWYSGSQILRNSEHAIAESALAGLDASRKLNESRLDMMSQNTISLAATHIFDRIRPFKSFDAFNSNYENVRNALIVQRDLQSLNQIGEGVYSSSFYLSDSDYVVSSDRGIARLDQYEPMDWLGEALERKEGISGVWVPRRLDSGVDVVSYVLPLSPLASNTRGTVIVNLKESQLEQDLRPSGGNGEPYMVLDQKGRIISHTDKSLLFTDGRKEGVVGDILAQHKPQGYMFRQSDGERFLYTWAQSDRYGWTYLNRVSVDGLMSKTNMLQKKIIFLTAVILFAGTVMTVFLASWLSKPARELVRTIRSRSGLGTEERNEFTYLRAAFRRMQEEEDALHGQLHVREQDARRLAVHNLLRGEWSAQAAAMFPERNFLVAALSIDRYRAYADRHDSETRSRHRLLLIEHCTGSFPEGVYVRGVYQGDGCFGLIINYGQEEEEREGAGIDAALNDIRDKALELLGHSITIGVSSPSPSSEQMAERMAEALEGIKHRMIAGGGGIAYWGEQERRGDKRYIYPANSERRILNFLDQGHFDSIAKELTLVSAEIRTAEYISYDNILFIYHQLAGVTIKHLRENYVHTARIFTGRGNVYAALASIDTLDEMEEYLLDFYREIIQHLERPSGGGAPYGELIVSYIGQRYREDIVFEEMAGEIGISYSYMRKIAYELLGMSLIDYVNKLRIEQAKELLLNTRMTMAQIAQEVGYYNVQSFNRFFRKFEGMPPSGYKQAKAQNQTETEVKSASADQTPDHVQEQVESQVQTQAQTQAQSKTQVRSGASASADTCPARPFTFASSRQI